MQTLITMDEYELLAEIDSDGNIMVISGNIDDGDGNVRDLTDDECQAAGKKHQFLIEEILLAKLEETEADNRADEAIERHISSQELAA